MWFDAQRALAELEAGEICGSDPLATTATTATPPPEARPRVASVASVATPPSLKSKIPPAVSLLSEKSRPHYATNTRARGTPTPARDDGLHPDAGALLDFLRRAGPHTYGAAARAMGWPVTRAWQAEARLRAEGLIRYGEHGRAHPVGGANL